jgi:hypothetical protein
MLMMHAQAQLLCLLLAAPVQYLSFLPRVFPPDSSADWMVHEATFDDRSAQMAIPRGHSTARMAGAFAAQCQAKSLLLTHFRYSYLLPSSSCFSSGMFFLVSSHIIQKLLPMAFPSSFVFCLLFFVVSQTSNAVLVFNRAPATPGTWRRWKSKVPLCHG